ncbi:MAG TPA: diguanylate cyclase [Telluria sp.]|nr:diguanylate cyclase [Telluria sp.]
MDSSTQASSTTRTLPPFLHRAVLTRLALFLVVSLPLVWVLTQLEHAKLERIAQQESTQNVSNLARAFAQEVDSTVGTVDVALLALRTHWAGNHAEFARVVNGFDRELKSKVIFQVGIIDAGGILRFVSSRPGRLHIDVSDREHVSSLLRNPTDRLVISPPLVGRASGVVGVHFARPIFDGGGRLAGVIVASVAPEYFSRFYNNIELGADATTSVVRDGVVLSRSSRSGNNRYIGATLSGYPHVTGRVETAGAFRRVSQLDGIDRFYGWRKLPHYDMLVMVGQSASDARQRYASQQQYATAMGVVISLALAALGWGAITARHNRVHAQKALASAEARWKLALNASGAGVWDWNVPTQTVMFTPQAQALLGIGAPSMHWTFDSMAGRIHPEDHDAVADGLRDLLAGRTPDYRAEYRVERAPGDTVWVLERAMVVEHGDDGSPVRVVGTVTNIDERKVHEAEMRHMASHDPLTGLANRALFSDRLQQAIHLAQREKRRLAVIYFDLDKFKPVNDTHGHGVGDQLLMEVATRVRASLRQSDTLARLGGDEFAVLLPNCGTTADAMKVAENILALLNAPYQVGGLELHISGSIGVSVYPDSGPDAGRVVHQADQAMYRSKQEGRNRATLYGAGDVA